MKTCFKCNEKKPLNDFYKHKAMGDGHLNKCKECNKKDTQENRLKNLDYYLEYDRSRANNPDRVEARQSYSNTEQGKEAHNRAKRKWVLNNSKKRQVINQVNNAIKKGNLMKQKMCSECGKTGVRIEGHHDDYNQPLSVRWLCSECHRAWHKENDAIGF
jgi:ribosomal protein S27AE